MSNLKPKPKIKYLSNKELLFEIHRSKKTYCYFVDDEYADFDMIVENVEDITKPEIIEEAKVLRAKRLKEINTRNLLLQGQNPKEFKEEIDVKSDEIDENDLVFRVMTYDHIPLDLERKKSHRTEADRRVKLPFPPFKHFVIEDNQPKEVGRSHWKGGLHNGYFDIDEGYITNRLADMFMKIVSRYSLKPNWRGYSYLDEMKSHALLQLSAVGLKFNESRSANPFAFYTQIIKNSFRGALLDEKKNQNLRDELLIAAGSTPSSTKQGENDLKSD